MTRRRSSFRTSSRRSGWRVGAASIVAALGYLATVQTLAYSLRMRSPEQAYRLSPGDGRITAQLSEVVAGPSANRAGRERADRLARLALGQDAMAVPAVATLGIDAAIRGDDAVARRSFAYSKKLSRRDLRTRIWAIEDAVARGDIAGALINYDIALRTSRIAPELLFPVLATAIADARIRDALVRTMARRPAWNNAFVNYVDEKLPDPVVRTALFTGLRQAGTPLSDSVRSHAVDGLMAGGFVEEAWRYYSAIRPGADRRTSRDPRFTANIDVPSSFDWSPVNDSGISASIQRGQSEGIFDFSVATGVGGVLLRQQQVLPPGRYLLEGRSLSLEPADGPRPYWVLTCPDGRELGRVKLPRGAEGGRFAGRFVVAMDCPRQMLTLVVRASDAVAGVSGRIDEVRLRPDGGTGE